MKRVLIAMSGGVDSSVAALLLRERGYDCVGCTMQLHQAGACGSQGDAEDARAVASGLGMPHQVLPLGGDFRTLVIDPFIESYQQGRTPNPCIRCNQYLKFGRLYEEARKLGCDGVATGHYARIEFSGGQYFLKKGLDPSKDQSYVLYFLTQEQLAHTLFPLGELSKAETRRIAGAHGFVNAAKPDSQDICFVPDGDYAAVIERYTGTTAPPGDFIDREGRVLGRHRGIIHYTVGQRKGLGVSAPERLYVQNISPQDNTVTLCYEKDMRFETARAEQFHWISESVPTGAVRCGVRLRYQQPEQPATVIPTGKDSVHIVFDRPQRAVTPGQAAVAYDGDTVLGGGIIVNKAPAGHIQDTQP